MNRFVVILNQSYDMFNVDVPHAVVTKHTRDDIIAAFRDHLDHVGKWFDNYRPGSGWNPPYLSKPILDTGLQVDNFEIGDYETRAVHAQVLTVDEWFETAVPH